jgi:hypothetical protein
MTDFKLYRYDEYTTLNDYRLTSIEYSYFLEFISASKNPNKCLYKNIENPVSDIMIYQPGIIYNKDYYVAPSSDVIYPPKEISIICEPNISNNNFLVFPLNDALFTINLIDGETKRGFWKDNVKWLSNKKIESLWTDSKCVLININKYNI